ncbi:unnamed protein product [Closterium sp. NIES-54]
MGKSLGNSIDPDEQVTTFRADVVRYFFLKFSSPIPPPFVLTHPTHHHHRTATRWATPLTRIASLPLSPSLSLHQDGHKMGKSLGNTIDPDELVTTFGVDAVRYFFLREIEFGSDGDFSKERFVNIVNANLANTIGGSEVGGVKGVGEEGGARSRSG